MSTIAIETLTPVHIGSGETLHFGTDFVRGEHQGQQVLSIVDLKKVMELIGQDNIKDWVGAIEHGETTDEIVRRYSPAATITDYSKRMILDRSMDETSDMLNTQIHDGFGRPYIPGSSIKGAIRTAIVSTLVDTIEDKEVKIDKTKRDARRNPISDRNGKIRYKANAQSIEAELFGYNPKFNYVDPNKDVFRFLQVGDACFGEIMEMAIRMVNINEREKHSFWDETKSQLIESIPAKKQTEIQLKLNETGYAFSKKRVNKLPDCMSSIAKMFEAINAHTKRVLQAELDYWEKFERRDCSKMVTKYLNRIDEMLNETQQCKPSQECILRIGYGSGWSFITGSWTKELNNFKDLVVRASRPNYNKYEKYDFPKTRRVDDRCELLGFVKLSIKEETI